jgi:hypothetical protein
MQATQLWSHWQDVLSPFAVAFTAPGWRRFEEWITGLVLNVEEHTVTQSLVGLERTGDWKALESFVEYGSWNRDCLERVTARELAQAPGHLWYGYQVWAGDDSKVHRSSANVWGTCTFHEYTARCPNRASTVRAHNWVVLGALLHRDDQPACFLPQAGRLYFRESQLPAGESFHTKNEHVVEMLRNAAKAAPSEGAAHLGVLDGAFAVANVVRPLVSPESGEPRVEFLTRLRHDARLYALPSKETPKGRRGPKPKWGKRLPPPRCGGHWPGAWQEGEVFLYGRCRKVQWKEMVCLWGVLGHDVKVKVVVATVEGYSKRFTLVCSALDLTGLQMVEIFAARFRQEDGFRDLKQRLGWEECRAWTKEPILRTTQAELLAMTLLRLLQFRLEEAEGDEWWFHPPWNRRKTRPSVLDLERLLREHRSEINALLSEQLGSSCNSGEDDEAA